MMENVMQKKTLWAGVVSGGIQFFNSDPTGNVEGISGSRKFYVEQNGKLTDDNGNNLVTSVDAGHGQDNAGSVQQSQDNTGPVGGAAMEQNQNTSTPTA